MSVGYSAQELFQAWDQGLLPAPSWILKGLVTGGRMLIYGRPKAGKSFAAAQIAHALHHQQPLWWCPAPSQPLRVLYVMIDVPLATMLSQWRDALPDTQVGISHYQHPDPSKRIERFFLSESSKRAQARKVIQSYQPQYVIWDGLTFLHAGLNFNERGSVMMVYKSLEAIWSGPQLVVAHANQEREDEVRHAVERIAGNKAISADADCGVLIESSGKPAKEGWVAGNWYIWNRLDPDVTVRMRRVPKGQPGSGGWVEAPLTPALSL